MKKTPLFGLLAVGALTLLLGGCVADRIVAVPEVAASPAPEQAASQDRKPSASPAPASVAIRLRCAPDFSGPQPLFVVDGRVVDPIAHQGEIEPEDILSIEIVKGRSALGTYGEAGKNGVVVITTRRGAGTR